MEESWGHSINHVHIRGYNQAKQRKWYETAGILDVCPYVKETEFNSRQH